MANRRKGEVVQADASLEQAKRSSPLFKKLLAEHQGGHGHDQGYSVREEHHKGHHIVIKTTYEVKVDGKKFSGPLFLPWHRLMLRTLEQLIASALGNSNFGLPYWDWAVDGDLPTLAARRGAPIWANNCMGQAAAAPGPFTLAAFPIRLAANAAGTLVQVNRALQRARGVSSPNLPTHAATSASLTATPYDVAPWNINSASGFHNRVEGWNPASYGGPIVTRCSNRLRSVRRVNVSRAPMFVGQCSSGQPT